MIYITKNTNTTVTVQAQELNTTGDYLWRLYNSETKQELFFYVVPSVVSERYIQFELDLDIDEGDGWEYEIYNGSDPDVDYISMLLLEVGKMVVEPQTQS
jgi:hypothetical protein